MTHPSTAWKEQIDPGEEAAFQKVADVIVTLQKATTSFLGKSGRGLHRKPRGVLRGTLEIASGLPEHAAQGLFAKPARYDVIVRTSNGSGRTQPDHIGDIRGFAIKVLDVKGPGALGSPVTSQDFLLINREVFGIKTAAMFGDLVKAVAAGPAAVLKHCIKHYGFFKAFGEAKKLQASVSRPFSGYLSETFSSTVPIACGKWAVRVRVVPMKSPPPHVDVEKAIAGGDATFAFQLQFFVDEQRTPIEDASVNWEESASPWLTVGTLTIPRQDLGTDEHRAFSQQVEEMTFDPWNALEEHRPLGHIQRARKVAYYASQQARARAT
jgi:catalase